MNKKAKGLSINLLWLAVIIFFALSPLVIGIIGGYLSERITNQPCHEGNCFWGTLPWFTMFTLPIGGIILVIYLIIITAKLLKTKQIKFIKKKKNYWKKKN